MVGCGGEDDEDVALHQIAMFRAGHLGEDVLKIVEIQEHSREHDMWLGYKAVEVAAIIYQNLETAIGDAAL